MYSFGSNARTLGRVCNAVHIGERKESWKLGREVLSFTDAARIFMGVTERGRICESGNTPGGLPAKTNETIIGVFHVHC